MSETSRTDWSNIVQLVILVIATAVVTLVLGKSMVADSPNQPNDQRITEKDTSEKTTSTDTTEEIIAKDTTDEFTGNRTVKTRSVSVPLLKPEGASASTEAFLYYTNETSDLFPDDISKYYLVLAVESGEWNFRRGEAAYFLVDGKRYEERIDAYNMDIGSSVYEQMGIRLGIDFRGRLVRSNEVKVKVGRYVWDVTEALDEEMRVFQDTTSESLDV
jgi:hypothetical protein